MVSRIPSVHIGFGSIPDFLWSGVKLSIWLSALLLTITWATDVWMAYVRPFSKFTLQGLFQRYKEHLKERCFDLCNRTLKLRESQRTPSSHFWECKSHPHTCLQSGVATSNVSSMSNLINTIVISSNLFFKLALCMSWIVKSYKIITSFNKPKH